MKCREKPLTFIEHTSKSPAICRHIVLECMCGFILKSLFKYWAAPGVLEEVLLNLDFVLLRSSTSSED